MSELSIKIQSENPGAIVRLLNFLRMELGESVAVDSIVVTKDKKDTKHQIGGKREKMDEFFNNLSSNL